MQLFYHDEYGEEILKVDVEAIPRVGDSVIIDDEDYRVKNITWHPREYSVIVSITQNIIRSQETDDSGNRLKEMNRAIIDLNNRQDKQEKKSRSLSEQLVSVRTHIKNQPKTKPKVQE